MPGQIGAGHICDLDIRPAKDLFHSSENSADAGGGWRCELLLLGGISVQEETLRVFKQDCLIAAKPVIFPHGAQTEHGLAVLLKVQEQSCRSAAMAPVSRSL